MGPANKVLTVSYGTFSCTLEGFDDPFSAMREIAEYFRDLAEKDRYFGAEPPELDIATVKELAEGKSEGHVIEAEADGSAVMLRATPIAAADEASGVAADETGTAIDRLTRIRETEEDIVDVDAEDDVDEFDEVEASAEPAEDVAPELEAQDDVPDPVEEDEAPEIVAHEDASTDEESPEIETVQDLAPAFFEDDSADMPEDTALEDEPVAEVEMASDEFATDKADDDLEALEPVSEIEAEEIGDDQRASGLEANGVDAFAEAEPVDNFDDDEDDFDTDELVYEAPADTAVATMGAEDDAEDAAAAAAEVEDENVESAGAEDSIFEAEFSADEDAPSEEAAADDIPETDSDDDHTIDGETVRDRVARRFQVRKARRAGAGGDLSLASGGDDAEPSRPMEPIQTAAERLAEEPEPEAMRVIDLPGDDESDLMAELAAIEADMADDEDGQADLPEEDAVSHGFLSPADDDDDEEEDLAVLSELAALRAGKGAEMRPGPIDEDQDEPMASEDLEEFSEDDEAPMVASADAQDVVGGEIQDDADVGESAAAAKVKPGLDDPDGPDMERLFAATDSRLTGEDASRRHANISHLKAAVAARRADDGDAPDETDDDATDAYRADLASTVRPRRAARPVKETEEARTERPEKPSPLVLVSEQRVGSEVEEAEPQVQPRRMATRPETAEALDEGVLTPETPTPAPTAASASSADGFEKFAAEVGAVELPEILEAAAVYSVKVMGEEVFSRPHLLHLASEAVEDLSREDGLRGFGQLLRDGTLRKVSRGTFSLGTSSRFAASADRAAS